MGKKTAGEAGKRQAIRARYRRLFPADVGALADVGMRRLRRDEDLDDFVGAA